MQNIHLFALLLLGLFGGGGGNNAKEKLRQYSEKIVLSKEELLGLGIIVENEPKATLEPRGFFAKKGYFGHFYVMYGEPTDIGYFISLYESQQGAREQYSNLRKGIAETANEIIEENTSENPYIFTKTKNKEGKDNLTLLQNYKNFHIMVIATSELKTSGDSGNKRIMEVAKSLARKIDTVQ